MSATEPVVFGLILSALLALNLREGARTAALEAELALTPKELYARLARSQVKWQIVDVRPDPAESYEDAHIPGALPFPGCDPAAASQAVRERVLGSVPTIVVSAEGDSATFRDCARRFTAARNLEGGMTAWSDANLPEDSGEYVPPKASAGGGCL